ncbi:3-isopropylmalate dehydratase [Alphaproteobacteria bacterium]|nr:3-isopropylmalate dehydratase [Alphaproteobacteria bacterium]|tara:strand:+ start:53 stop:589 length:537 start_codon:yes stop_codon:yes gene_type:complete
MKNNFNQINKALVYGDEISTDDLAPGAYLKLSVEEMSKHCLESIDPNFVSKVRKGDILVAGKNFGVGSSREQAAISLVILGISYVIAENFARIFYRNAFNVGLIPLICSESSKISLGDKLKIDPIEGSVENLTKKEIYKTNHVPSHLMDIVNSGGLLKSLKIRLKDRKIKNAKYRILN